jgi:hypothetical protein
MTTAKEAKKATDQHARVLHRAADDMALSLKAAWKLRAKELAREAVADADPALLRSHKTRWPLRAAAMNDLKAELLAEVNNNQPNAMGGVAAAASNFERQVRALAALDFANGLDAELAFDEVFNAAADAAEEKSQ